jgi:hypothetical protein
LSCKQGTRAQWWLLLLLLLLLLQYALVWAELAFSVAVAEAVETMGAFPSSLEALRAMILGEMAQCLGAIG